MLTILVSVVSAENSFSNIKIIKIYYILKINNVSRKKC